MRLWLICLIALTSGCLSSSGPARHIAVSPEVEISPNGSVKLSGDAEIPAKASAVQANANLPIPEGSTFVFNEKLGTMTLTVSKATQMALKSTQTTVEGPKSFTPDKGPTIGEEKQAQADYWSTLCLRLGVAIGVTAGLFGLVRHWDLVMYGGGAVAGACLFELFVQRHPILLVVIGLGVATAIVGPIIYHTKIKPLEQTPPSNPSPS